MHSPRLLEDRGVTLIEVMIAVAIFAVVIGVSAQALLSFYVSLDMQEERVESLQAARAVLSAIREKKEEFVLPEDEFDWEGLIAWLDEGNDTYWSSFLKPGVTGTKGLHDHTITVAYYDMQGNPAPAGASPLQVNVMSSWSDMKGRTITAQVATLLTTR